MQNLTREQKIQLLKLIEEKKRRESERGALFTPNAMQDRVLKSPALEKYLFAGNGCWAKGTLIRLFDGTLRPVEELKVGDQVMGPDSTPRTILRLVNGFGKMYSVEAVDGSSDPMAVCEDHELALSYAGTKGTYTLGDKITLSVKELVKMRAEAPHGTARVLYGYRTAVDYPEQPVLIDPYCLGAWLGDGSSRYGQITSMDLEIVNAFIEAGYTVTERSQGFSNFNSKAKSFSITDLPLKELGVLNNKHIPKQYLINSKKVRLQLLAGLIDTDGYKGNTGYEITQKRLNLHLEIKTLAQSLGFSCTSAIKVIKGTPYYRLYISGPVHHIPCKLQYKRFSKISQRMVSMRYKLNITSLPDADFYGFTVDKDNLIVMPDYTVTKNCGKSAMLVNQAHWLASGYNPLTKEQTEVPCRIALVIPTPEKINSFIEEYRKYNKLDVKQLHKKGKAEYCLITYPNGSHITVFTHDISPLKAEGLELDAILFDEPPPRSLYISLARGGRTKGRKLKILLAGTPISASWMRTEIYAPWVAGELPLVECFSGRTEENAHNLAEGYIERFAARLSEKERAVRLEGQFFDIDGLALAHLFDYKTHVLPRKDFHWDKGNPVIVAIDPHPNKAHVACMLGVNEYNQMVYLKEMAAKLVPREFARELKRWYQDFRVIDIIVDNLGSGDTTGGDGFKSFIQVLNEEGVRCRATSWIEKGDEAFITRIQEALTPPLVPDNFGNIRPPLMILEGNGGIIRDIENVQWLANKGDDTYKPKLDIAQMDYLATLKYALAANIKFARNNAKPYTLKNPIYGFKTRPLSRWKARK